MTLREELEERADKLDAELLDLSGRIKEIERQSNELHTCLNALDIAEMDAEDAAIEAEQEAASEQLASDHALPFAADDVVIEIEASNQSESCVSSLGAETGLQPSPGGVEESPDQFEESPALNEAMQDEREQPVEDGYAPVTNPEADQVVSAMSWYEPKAIAERSKFDPFGLFKREKEEA